MNKHVSIKDEVTANAKRIDKFTFHLIEFMSNLHDCHICSYTLHQINGRGKKRTFCGKYMQPVQRVRWHCFDRFLGFYRSEINNIRRQYIAGKCTLVLDGVLK